MHRSRLCYATIDCNDLDVSTAFWAAALGAEEEPFADTRAESYRRLHVPNSDVGVILQLVPEPKTAKSRIHLCIESDNGEAESKRLQHLGATLLSSDEFGCRVFTDPAGNEFCVIRPAYPELLASRGRVQD